MYRELGYLRMYRGIKGGIVYYLATSELLHGPSARRIAGTGWDSSVNPQRAYQSGLEDSGSYFVFGLSLMTDIQGRSVLRPNVVIIFSSSKAIRNTLHSCSSWVWGQSAQKLWKPVRDLSKSRKDKTMPDHYNIPQAGQTLSPSDSTWAAILKQWQQYGSSLQKTSISKASRLASRSVGSSRLTWRSTRDWFPCHTDLLAIIRV
jgi:hypothetical protein